MLLQNQEFLLIKSCSRESRSLVWDPRCLFGAHFAVHTKVNFGTQIFWQWVKLKEKCWCPSVSKPHLETSLEEKIFAHWAKFLQIQFYSTVNACSFEQVRLLNRVLESAAHKIASASGARKKYNERERERRSEKSGSAGGERRSSNLRK